jgi:hypothetical protein
VVLAIGHALRAHEVLGRPDTPCGFLEVVHRLVKDGVFVGHGKSIRPGRILRSPGYCVFSRELPYQSREVAGCVPGYVRRVLRSHPRIWRRSGTARVLQGVGQKLDVFIHAFKYPIYMQGIQARPHFVAFWVGAHELCQTFEPIANQDRLTQLLGHRRNALVCRP